MVTEIDLWALKTRIKDILENDLTLSAYFRSFEVGAPNANIPDDWPMPYLFVTNDEGLIIGDEEASTVQNDAPVTSRQSINLMTIFMDSEKDGPTTEKAQDDIQKRIKEVLKENYHLKDPVALNDPMAFRSYPEEVRGLNSSMIGREVQGRVVMFKVIAYTA